MQKSMRAEVKGLIAQMVMTIPVFRLARMASFRVKDTIRNIPTATTAPMMSQRKIVQLNLPFVQRNTVLLSVSVIIASFF